MLLGQGYYTLTASTDTETTLQHGLLLPRLAPDCDLN